MRPGERMAKNKDDLSIMSSLGVQDQIEEKTRNGILCTPSVNPPRKQRMSFRQRSVTSIKSFLRAFTREKRYPTCFKFCFVSSPHVIWQWRHAHSSASGLVCAAQLLHITGALFLRTAVLGGRR